MQLLAAPLDPIPIGVVGKVVGIGPEAALIRFRSKYPPTYVKFSELERASFVDLLPVAAQPLARAFGGRVVALLGVAIVAAVTAVVTLLAARALGK